MRKRHHVLDVHDVESLQQFLHSLKYDWQSTLKIIVVKANARTSNCGTWNQKMQKGINIDGWSGGILMLAYRDFSSGGPFWSSRRGRSSETLWFQATLKLDSIIQAHLCSSVLPSYLEVYPRGQSTLTAAWNRTAQTSQRVRKNEKRPWRWTIWKKIA